MLERLFEIKHSDPDINYHQLGRKASKPYYWELRVEQFKYNQENIKTGISDIDLVGVLNSYTQQLHLLASSGSGNYVIGEEVYQGSNYLTASSTATVSDWNPDDKVLSVINIVGEFTGDTEVTGVQSGTYYTLKDIDDLEDHVPDDTSDNVELGDEALFMIDTSEVNPLGNTGVTDVMTDAMADGDDVLVDGNNFLIP